MRFKHLRRVGVELEGTWLNSWRVTPSLALPEAGVPWAAHWQNDVSVRRESRIDAIGLQRAYETGTWSGECTSPPMIPKEVYKWVLHNHPPWVGDSCGMHVHMSFKKTLDYARLMEEPFNDYLVERLLKWGEANAIPDNHIFWARVRGTHRYCEKKLVPESQIWYPDKSGTRYTQLNFAWARYRTIECRILPMFDNPEVGVSAVRCLLESTEKYLIETKFPKEKPVKEVAKYDLKAASDNTVCELAQRPVGDNWTGRWEMDSDGSHWFEGETYFGSDEELYTQLLGQSGLSGEEIRQRLSRLGSQLSFVVDRAPATARQSFMDIILQEDQRRAVERELERAAALMRSIPTPAFTVTGTSTADGDYVEESLEEDD